MKEANTSPVRPTSQPYFPEGLVQKCCVTVRGIRRGFRKGVVSFSLSAVLLPKRTNVGEVRVTVGEMLEEEMVRTANVYGHASTYSGNGLSTVL